MPSIRFRPWRRQAMRRASRRRGGEPAALVTRPLLQPLPPLVPPDDDREFVASPRLPEPDAEPA